MVILIATYGEECCSKLIIYDDDDDDDDNIDDDDEDLLLLFLCYLLFLFCFHFLLLNVDNPSLYGYNVGITFSSMKFLLLTHLEKLLQAKPPPW